MQYSIFAAIILAFFIGKGLYDKKKMKAINDDERAFFEFLGAHEDFLEKLNKDDSVRWDMSRMMKVRGILENYNTGLYMVRFKGSIGKSLW